ncbi:MAG TPA: hypothetical protein VHB47_15770 [Thermoanaerobaculia bacterium]|jgi:hypothetical protein|nr:hypothetical protein [Thermoanaerobaculia bacterium]
MPAPVPRAARPLAAYGRAAAALLLFSAWMGLLFAGFLLHGALHLLLVAAALLFPWRAPASPAAAAGQDDLPQD